MIGPDEFDQMDNIIDSIKNPSKVKPVPQIINKKVFVLKQGMHVEIGGYLYKVITANKKGRVMLNNRGKVT